MYQFGVKLHQEDDGRITATLVDLPEGPRGDGATAEEAYQNLIVNSAETLTKYLIAGGLPRPLTNDKTAAIGISMPSQVHVVPPATPTPAPAQTIGPRDKGWTWNYSWRNNTVSTEG
jgi:hypothetical protein